LALPRTVDSTAPRGDLALAVVLRSVAHPVLAWGLGTALGPPAHALLAAVAMASLPTAQNVLVYAMQYRHGEALARDAGLVTTVLCVRVLRVAAATLGSLRAAGRRRARRCGRRPARSARRRGSRDGGPRRSPRRRR